MSEIRPHGQALLAAARAERNPTAGDRERVFGALMASAALSAASSGVAAPSLRAWLLGGAGKWWLLGGLLATAGAGVYVSRSASGAATRAPAARVAVSSLAATVPVPVSVPVSPPVAVSPSAVSPSAVSPSAVSPSVVSPSAVSPSAHAPSPAARAVSSQREAAPTSLEQELRQLHAAHAAYRSGQPAQALALIAQHKRSFPKSQLQTERSTLEVLSLCRLGRTARAKELAALLRSAAPGSAALSGLEGSCVSAQK